MMGKIEIESLEEGRDAQIAENLVKAAVLTVFKDRFTPERFRPIVTAFEEGAVIHAGEDVTSAEYVVAARAAAGPPRGRDRPHRRRRVRRVGGVRRRAPPRGPAPQQAPQQGRRRRPRHLPRQGLARRLRRYAATCRDVVSPGRPGGLGGGLGVAVPVEEAEAHVEAAGPTRSCRRRSTRRCRGTSTPPVMASRTMPSTSST